MRTVAENDLVFAVWQDWGGPNGVGTLIIKGANKLRDSVATGRTFRCRVAAINCVCVNKRKRCVATAPPTQHIERSARRKNVTVHDLHRAGHDLRQRATPGDADGALLSKRISLGIDGKPVSDGTPCRMATGTAITTTAANANALARLIEGMLPCNALALGSILGGNETSFNVVTASALARLRPEQRSNNVISRTREYINFRDGAPAWLLVDYDLKGMPTHVAGRIKAAGGLWQALLSAAPGLACAARVVRASTSAPGCGGVTLGCSASLLRESHTYALVEDGADIDRALQTLHERCWLHGLGWYLCRGSGPVARTQHRRRDSAVPRAPDIRG